MNRDDFCKKISRILDHDVLYTKFRYDMGMTSDMASDAADFVMEKIEEAMNENA